MQNYKNKVNILFIIEIMVDQEWNAPVDGKFMQKENNSIKKENDRFQSFSSFHLTQNISKKLFFLYISQFFQLYEVHSKRTVEKMGPFPKWNND